jgi:hypothetical protein
MLPEQVEETLALTSGKTNGLRFKAKYAGIIINLTYTIKTKNGSECSSAV